MFSYPILSRLIIAKIYDPSSVSLVTSKKDISSPYTTSFNVIPLAKPLTPNQY